jgi:hypothetical protein
MDLTGRRGAPYGLRHAGNADVSRRAESITIMTPPA